MDSVFPKLIYLNYVLTYTTNLLIGMLIKISKQKRG